ncbi:phosphodiester glycosidase family protein [Rhodocaloribacter litoris]|uniref:phosphodiester glycosidase family protein n=1 Tax=Rhodocaloribacter litoris TaxID=2558931 RepID=UPI0014210C53|nr:phosphodiester glycosidase family protein [Rhodocaloribacter litoris]QXD14300.1 phosphodiester glycosidase family protein [Rhodocaloribacter litoris]GIV60701.1 MAG: hypothetical protein KatS3mg043_1790 [Rhodothermaceae bacterium]
MSQCWHTGFVLLLAVTACGQQPRPEELEMNWEPVEDLNADLPPGVRVYAGRNDRLPLRAWYVRIDEADPAITTRVVVSDEPDRRETVESFARDLGACVVVNGGYFVMSQNPARHAGLLLIDSILIEPATRSVVRDTVRYEAARAALGLVGDSVAFAWVTTRRDTVYAWAEPPAHRPGHPAPPLRYEAARPWPVRDALSAGPALVVGGQVRVTTNEEVFFGSAIPDVHPRTAVGRTADGALLVLVVDGRQLESRGVNLEELAWLMRGIGAVDAINLDGGGSVSLVVGGRLVNRPVGGTALREVMSALATFCE